MIHVRALALVAALTFAATTHAAYTTPGSGVDWTLDDLVAASAGAVTGGGSSYAVNDAVIIAVGDRVTIAAGTTLQFFGGNTVGIEVNGSLAAVGTESQPIIFTATAATPGAWRGLDFEDTAVGSAFHLAWCEIGYADIGVDVFGADILVEDSTIHHCSNRALDFSTAGGSVLRCTIRDNQTRTITATLTSSPLIENCWFENNNIQKHVAVPVHQRRAAGRQFADHPRLPHHRQRPSHEWRHFDLGGEQRPDRGQLHRGLRLRHPVLLDRRESRHQVEPDLGQHHPPRPGELGLRRGPATATTRPCS
jgi:hypothetical protein